MDASSKIRKSYETAMEDLHASTTWVSIFFLEVLISEGGMSSAIVSLKYSAAHLLNKNCNKC